MKNLPENTLDPEEDLKASNELMKLKLELDHKLVMSETSNLSPATENQWLNHIYNFEKLHKESHRAKVYDVLDRPSFAKYDSLTENELHNALFRLQSLLAEKSIVLNCCCDYNEAVIYRFITEELFEYEMDAFVMEGMVRHFIYEEFHPNHDYDLRRYATRFIESILNRKWNEEYDSLMLTDPVSFQGNNHLSMKISSIVLAFQEAHTHFVVEKIEIETVNVDIENERGSIESHLAYIAHPREGKARLFKGNCIIHFEYENDDWNVSGFQLPGFG